MYSGQVNFCMKISLVKHMQLRKLFCIMAFQGDDFPVACKPFVAQCVFSGERALYARPRRYDILDALKL